MRPFLESGNWVGVEWLKQDDLRSSPKLGELVLCRNRQGVWVLHRIIALPSRRDKSWMVKGDASFIAENFSSAELWGKVIAFRRGEKGKTLPWACKPLDRWIAYCSRQTLIRKKLEAAFFRRAVRGLAWMRRLTH